MIQMTVHRVGLRAADGEPIVVLREENGERCLTLTASTAQANAIMRCTHRVPPFRPQTHEVVLAVIAELGSRVVDARLGLDANNALVAVVRLVRQHSTAVVGADVIDAIVLALRSHAPILVSPEAMNRLGSPRQRVDGGKEAPATTAPRLAPAAKDPFHEFIRGLASVDELGP